MKGNKDYYAGYELSQRVLTRANRLKKQAPIKGSRSKSKEKGFVPGFRTDQRISPLSADKASRSKTHRSQHAFSKTPITSGNKLRTTVANGRSVKKRQRQTSLEKNINNKNSSPLSTNRERSAPKAFVSKGTIRTSQKLPRQKKPKGKTRKKPHPVGSSQFEEDPPIQILKSSVIRKMKLVDSGHPEQQWDNVRRSERQSYTCSQEVEIQTTFQVPRHQFGIHQMPSITIQPVARTLPLDTYSPIETTPNNDHFSPILDELVDHSIAKRRHYSITQKMLCSPIKQASTARKDQMLNCRQPFRLTEGFSTNLYSVMLYIGRVQIYLEPMKGQVCRRLAMKGRSPLERIRDMQSEQEQAHPVVAGTVIPAYIFQEVQDIYSVSLETQPFQFYHEKCIFDCINDKLAEKLRKNQPYCWQTGSSKLKKYTEIRELFDEVQRKIIADASCLYGTLGSSSNSYVAQHFSEEFELTRQRLTDLTMEIVIQLTDIIFEGLIEELQLVCAELCI